MDHHFLSITCYSGEYNGDISALTHVCDIDGSAAPEGRPPFTPLEEALRVLEMCTRRYRTPSLEGEAMTVFVGRKVRGRTTPLARLDVVVKDGQAHANVVRDDTARVAIKPVPVNSDDDVAPIVRKILESLVRGQ